MDKLEKICCSLVAGGIITISAAAFVPVVMHQRNQHEYNGTRLTEKPTDNNTSWIPLLASVYCLGVIAASAGTARLMARFPEAYAYP